MRDDILIRLSGLTALVGGLLRVASASTIGMFDEHVLALSYFATDLMLVFGLTGIYLNHRSMVGFSGLVGLATAISGLLMVRNAELFGGYQTSAAVALLGTSILALMLLLRTAMRFAPLIWLAAFALGLAATTVPLAGVAAGVAFGLGFAVAGGGQMLKPGHSPHK